MLEARALDYGYRGRPIGRDLNLSIANAEAVCVLGPNGAGKTSLFKTLLGLLPPLGGEVLLDGRDVSALSQREIARKLAYVPQAHASFFPFTAADIVLMGRAARVGLTDAPREVDRAAAHAALTKLRIAHLASVPYTRISGGERQLVLIARALAQDPRCLIMDEPTANLDLANQTRVLEVIADLTAEGLSVLFSTHDPDHAFACAACVALMREGAIVAVGAPDDVINAAALRSLYDIDVDVLQISVDGRKMCAPVLRKRGRRDGP
ncbi:MAG: ABC transporter ATP-binding protein [Caulobacterales bacterium]|jgi:iron complex transport system ATP-binding protein|nr:ABC transporter ATP-binding protein [Caulobacterales bacterium]